MLIGQVSYKQRAEIYNYVHGYDHVNTTDPCDTRGYLQISTSNSVGSNLKLSAFAVAELQSTGRALIANGLRMVIYPLQFCKSFHGMTACLWRPPQFFHQRMTPLRVSLLHITKISLQNTQASLHDHTPPIDISKC